MSYYNGPKIVTDGLVACLDAGNPKSYPSTGTTWSDLSVNGVVDCSSFTSTTSNGGPCNAIGRNWYDSLNGKIASVSYYNVAHTAAQVAENFKWAGAMAGI